VVPILLLLSKLGDFRCRVLILHGMIPQPEYDSLVKVTSYTVNAASGEGQCLPLMEFMSAGRPAIAPRHTAMLDYVTTENSFVIPTTLRPASWPHDPRQAIRCMQHAVSFAQLVKCYRESFGVARDRPQQYAAMSAAASAAQQRFCSDEIVTSRLREVLTHLGIRPRATPSRRSLRSVFSRVAT
jgi:glycosyltransferase involved in cell wall biosynthesis